MTNRLGCVGGLDARALEEEADRVGRLALTLAEGGHELLKLGAALDLEEDLVVVVRDLDVEVLAVGRGLRRGRGATVVVL